VGVHTSVSGGLDCFHFQLSYVRERYSFGQQQLIEWRGRRCSPDPNIVLYDHTAFSAHPSACKRMSQ
jgi:hypothetical protein